MQTDEINTESPHCGEQVEGTLALYSSCSGRTRLERMPQVLVKHPFLGVKTGTCSCHSGHQVHHMLWLHVLTSAASSHIEQK